MADNSKSKFSKEKLAKFFDKEGFYIVLFLCVCIVAITAVWVSRSGVEDTPQQEINEVNEDQTVEDNPTQKATTNNDEKVDTPVVEETKPTQPQSSNSLDSTSDGKTSSNSTGASTAAKAASVPVTFKLGNPVEEGVSTENTLRDYSPDKAVFFGYPNFEWRTHNGLDIKGVQGTEVFAAADGKVVEITDSNNTESGLGWTVVIDHNNGYRTVYANLSESIDVKLNANVKKGEKIGVIGSTSSYERDAADASSGDRAVSHLHFEVLKIGANSKYTNVDPKQYLTMQN